MTFYPMLFRCLLVLFLGALQAFIPWIGRRSLFFSVTVPESFRQSPEARRIFRIYRWSVWLCTLIAEALTVTSVYFESPGLLVAGALLISIGAMAAFAQARNRTRPFAIAQPGERVAPLDSTAETFPGGIANVAGPFLPIVGAALYLHAHSAAVLDTVALYMDLLIAAGMEIMLFLGALGVLYGARRGSHMRHITLVVVAAFMWVTSLMSSAMAVLPAFLPSPEPLERILPFAMLASTAGIIAWGVRKSSQSPGGSDLTPDECWKFGLFYYNPQDPALMVERRFGFGYSLNFANRMSWLLMALILGTVGILLPLAVILIANH